MTSLNGRLLKMFIIRKVKLFKLNFFVRLFNEFMFLSLVRSFQSLHFGVLWTHCESARSLSKLPEILLLIKIQNLTRLVVYTHRTISYFN